MDCRTTSIRGRRAGLTLTELLVGLALGAIVLAALAQLVFYSGRSMAALFNYTDLDSHSRRALDLMSREIRQANRLLANTDTSLTFEDFDGAPLQYNWDPETRLLTRSKGGANEVLLRDCDYLRFSPFQRNPIGGVYEQYPVGVPGTTKLVQVHWVCSRKILGSKVNTESVQSAKFVIRKQ